MSKESYKSFISLIKEIDSEERTQRDRGTLFELLVRTYLENEPMYKRLFEHVWLLSDVPEEFGIPKVDVGVDLVAKKRDTDDLVAIQCKYYSKDTRIRKEHVDSFLNEVGKSYYSEGLIVTTTDKWTKNADEALVNRDKTIMRISLSDLKDSRVDWSKYSFNKPKEVVLQEKKTPLPHQKPAIEAVLKGFDSTDRGKLIMAPGTGKTFTSMAITEEMTKNHGDVFKVLYLVPSIQLLSQTLRGWNADTEFNMESIAVCSDRKVTKERIGTEIEDIATADIGYPATTNSNKLIEYQQAIEAKTISPEIIAVFSTYQSIDVIIEAQKNGFYEFDLIVCDEAHRTTGATELNKEASAFTKVHSNNNIKASKRLYQTATPRVYGEDAKRKAEEMSVVIADMNDPDTYGEDFYRLGFGDAIRQGILTDYKVMVLAVDEDAIARRFQNMLATDTGLEFDDITKIVGCWNGLVKRDGNTNKTLGKPMQRAIAFTGTIKDSKMITEMFSTVVDEYLYKDGENEGSFSIDIKHADGTMNAIQKNEKIDWLKSDVPDNTCRVLSNARFLTEGVDVPDLDAVMFLKPRRSKIDIAQAVGRVMRQAEGKDYGYIILPIGVPSGAEAHSVLDNNEKYQVVWEILNALRSIDERFDATINKLELNKKKPSQIQVIGVGEAPEDYLVEAEHGSEQLELDLSEENLSDLERAIYGKIVQKVGNVRYWEQWSEDVAIIAQQHITRIKVMLEDKASDPYIEFKKFIKSLRYNLNDSITEHQAIEMLAQHLITKPVFEALFDSYSFAKNNPVSQAMESILDILDKQGLLKEQEKLEDFYESVRIRAEGIDNLQAKQEIIIQLYERFFKVGFKETTERLGIVYTPIEIVDFIIHSVNEILKEEFNMSLTDKEVNILDPFTGTGTFIVRLLQSGLINKESLIYKYTNEIHANEIVLLAYYIASINIEETFNSMAIDNELIGKDGYISFDGIVLTDTFQMTEEKGTFVSQIFDDNSERVNRQNNLPLKVIIGNPPYSARQRDANENNENVSYKNLDNRIRETYVRESTSQTVKDLYDPYTRAIRWSTDRMNDEGVIAFITNGSFIHTNTFDGFRKSLTKEFDKIYVLNLRGFLRGKSREDSIKEGENVFDIQTGVAIIILVKSKKLKNEKCRLYYYDIGDGLTKIEKLEKLKNYRDIKSIKWDRVNYNQEGDWINQRSPKYSKYIPIGDKRKGAINRIFYKYSLGLNTNRDFWVYNFTKDRVLKNMKKTIDFYNNEIVKYQNFIKNNENKEVRIQDIVDTDSTKISWSSSLYQHALRGRKVKFIKNALKLANYRPFTKKWVYYDRVMNHRPAQWDQIVPDDKENLVITISGKGSRKSFAALMTNGITDVNSLSPTQCFPLYFYVKDSEYNMFSQNDSNGKYYKVDTIADDALNVFRSKYNDNMITKKDVFYYIYGVLHSSEYRGKYQSELRQMLARIPFLKDFWGFKNKGEKLSHLHLNYEKVEPYSKVKEEVVSMDNNDNLFKVKKMNFGNENRKKDKTIIHYNDYITISNIPIRAYDYEISGLSAIEWIMNQYQVSINKASGIKNDPNEYSDNPRYILDLLKRIITVSVETLDIVNNLPPFEEID